MVTEALKGFENAAADRNDAVQPRRVALPASVAWRLAELGCRTPDERLRRRLAAVLASFWFLRRSYDFIHMRASDIAFDLDGGLPYQIWRHKTDGLPVSHRIAHTYPPLTTGDVNDVPLWLRSALWRRHQRSCSLDAPLFQLSSGLANSILSGWLREGIF